jgi:hypothetical protein
MAKLNEIVRLLEVQRQDLVNQLEAVDRAIAALGAAAAPSPEMRESTIESPEDDPAPVSPRQVKARRILTESHKVAMAAAKRKSVGARDAAKGIARERLDDGFVPAIGVRGEQHPPRLVKRTVKRE